MKTDPLLIKLSLLIFAQQFIAIFKTNITRWLIKTFFTTGELPLAHWYTPEFIQALNLSRIASLAVIASFTIVTFPLGMWIASYKVGQSYPVIRMIGGIMLLVTFPANIYAMSHILQELPLNPQTILGALIIEASHALLVVGAWIMYNGANGGQP